MPQLCQNLRCPISVGSTDLGIHRTFPPSAFHGHPRRAVRGGEKGLSPFDPILGFGKHTIAVRYCDAYIFAHVRNAWCNVRGEYTLRFVMTPFFPLASLSNWRTSLERQAKKKPRISGDPGLSTQIGGRFPTQHAHQTVERRIVRSSRPPPETRALYYAEVFAVAEAQDGRRSFLGPIFRCWPLQVGPSPPNFSTRMVSAGFWLGRF